MKLEPKSVERIEGPSGFAVLTVISEVTMDDGSVLPLKHRFPADTMEWRAAEYDIDPADMDLLLDIVLHEPLMDDADRPDLLLHDAPSVEEARSYHLSRVEKVRGKDRGRIGAGNPVADRIKELSIMNPEAIALKRAQVVRSREERAKQRLQALMVDPEAERLAGLRQALTRLPRKAEGKNAD